MKLKTARFQVRECITMEESVQSYKSEFTLISSVTEKQPAFETSYYKQNN